MKQAEKEPISMEIKIFAGIALLLILLTLLTHYQGSTDIADYSDTAKYFAGEQAANLRGSHSYLYGFLHAFPVKLFHNFIAFKLTSLIALFLTIYSLFIISKKNKKTLWLALLSPVVWYMAPWISPIQIAGLFFLWAYYFIEKYNKKGSIYHLAASGALIGLSWAFWDTMFFFGAFLIISFIFNKKFSHLLIVCAALLAGLAPRLAMDAFFFNFPFYTMLKSTMGTFANIFGGIYGAGMLERATSYSSSGIAALALVLLTIPIYLWKMYKPVFLKNNQSLMVFLSLSFLLILLNPQVRYTLILVPIILLALVKIMTPKQFKRQIIFSGIILLIFVFPYIIQIFCNINGSINGEDVSTIVENNLRFELSRNFSSDILNENIESLAEDYPNQIFVVGNQPDYFQLLAHVYWGDKIKEFASIQDYNLWLNNKTVLFEKKFMPQPKISDRRQIWLAGGMSMNEKNTANYSSIKFAVSLDEPIALKGFNPVKQYGNLYLYEKG